MVFSRCGKVFVRGVFPALHRSAVLLVGAGLFLGGNWRIDLDMADQIHHPRLRMRIVFGEAEMIGPGKAELLERIERTGSIAAAGREMKMSYKRAWTLIETLNHMFRDPVVESARGGPGVGGAQLTATGREVLRLYREFEAEAERAGLSHVTALQSLMKDISREK